MRLLDVVAGTGPGLFLQVTHTIVHLYMYYILVTVFLKGPALHHHWVKNGGLTCGAQSVEKIIQKALPANAAIKEKQNIICNTTYTSFWHYYYSII